MYINMLYLIKYSKAIVNGKEQRGGKGVRDSAPQQDSLPSLLRGHSEAVQEGGQAYPKGSQVSG